MRGVPPPAQGIAIHPEDYVYFFDMPPARKHEPFVQEVLEDMRRRPDVDPSRAERYWQKWQDLCDK